MNCQHKQYTDKLSQLAREQVKAYLVRDRELYVFGSEKACQRLIHSFEDQTGQVAPCLTLDPWYEHYIILSISSI